MVITSTQNKRGLSLRGIIASARKITEIIHSQTGITNRVIVVTSSNLPIKSLEYTLRKNAVRDKYQTRNQEL
jgi:hypothetical protein